jgi:nicotinic acid phosphoribosyltransferase
MGIISVSGGILSVRLWEGAVMNVTSHEGVPLPSSAAKSNVDRIVKS